MSIQVIQTIIRDFHVEALPNFFERNLDIPLDTQKIITLIGPRRSGKTSQLFNIMHTLLNNGLPKKNLIYINFEDERYDYETLELDHIIQAYLALYPELELSACYFFFDEIQNIPLWDRYIRRIYDTTTKHIFLSGSNAKLLSYDIATALRGRTLTYTVLPFSFLEYCEYQKLEIDLFSRQKKALLLNHLNTYLSYGGFPEIVHYETDLKIKTLQEYFNTMIYRDMVERYKIKNTHVIKYFLKRLFANATKLISVNKIYNELQSAVIKVGKQVLYDYLEMSENIFLTICLKKYSPTNINQELSERKIYIIDNGLLNAITYRFSENLEKYMEQLVLQELIRRGKTVFFYKDNKECDFIIQEGLDIIQAIQVCYDLRDADTLKRELAGLEGACKAFNLTEGMIITYEEDKIIEHKGLTFYCVSLLQWLVY